MALDTDTMTLNCVSLNVVVTEIACDVYFAVGMYNGKPNAQLRRITKNINT